MEAVELTANATATRGDHPVAVYLLLAPAMDGSCYVVTGIVARTDAKATVPALRKCARSLRRSRDMGARRDRAMVDLLALQKAAILTRAATGKAPDSLASVAHEVDGGIPKDPWGNDYVYERLPKNRFEFRCLGADGKPGGAGPAADIVWPRR